MSVRETDAGYVAHEWAARAHDQLALHVRTWQPAVACRARLLVVHGYQEHGGRYQALAQALTASGIETLAFDLRGHGRSAGPRGHVDRFSDYVADVDCVLAQAPARPVPTFVFGHSLGGLIALSATRARRPDVAGVLVTNPYLGLAMPVPAWKRNLGRLLGRIVPRFGLGNGIDSRWLTQDPDVLASYRHDPLLINHATAGWLVQTEAAQAALLEAPQVGCPLWFAYSDVDPVASPAVAADWVQRVQCPDKTIVCRHGELHELLQERGRLETIESMRTWLLDRLR